MERNFIKILLIILSCFSLKAAQISEISLLSLDKPVYSIAWSPDGTKLASAQLEQVIRIWDTNTIQQLNTLRGHSAFVNAIDWSPDGTKLASVASDGTLRIWDCNTKQQLNISNFIDANGYADILIDVVWSPDGTKLACASLNDTMRIWNLNSGQISKLNARIRYKPYVVWCINYLTSIIWSPDGSQLVYAAHDGTIKFLDFHTQKLNILDVNTDLEIYNDDLKGTVGLADGTKLPTYENYAHDIAWSPDGTKLASALHDNTIRIWDPNTREPLNTLIGHTDVVKAVSWSPDGSKLASASYDKTVIIWNPNTKEILNILIGHTDVVNAVSWSPDGTKLVSASSDGTIRFWPQTYGKNLKIS